jgi:excisionase family DNA binding protein
MNKNQNIAATKKQEEQKYLHLPPPRTKQKGQAPDSVESVANHTEQPDIEFYSFKDLSKILKLSKPTLIKLIKENEAPPGFKVGGQWRFPKSAFREWVKKSLGESSTL